MEDVRERGLLDLRVGYTQHLLQTEDSAHLPNTGFVTQLLSIATEENVMMDDDYDFGRLAWEEMVNQHSHLF